MNSTPTKESAACPVEQTASAVKIPLTKKLPFLIPTLSFLIPFLLMMLAFGLAKVYPFGFFTGDENNPNGSEQILNFDLWHQYYPFLQILRDKLVEGGSMFYTWIMGMGTNFISVISYYVASPLNLLLIVLPFGDLRVALTFGVLIKVGLAGLFFSIFAKKVLHRADFAALAFSCLYALCNYATGYYWNVMWMDVFAIFPLVMLGTHELFVNSKFKLYTITVALSLLMNYYIGYMVCIFVAITFFAYTVIYKINFRTFLRKLSLFAIFSLLACMLSGILTIPAFLGLQNAHGVTGGFNDSLSIYRGFEDLFGALFSYHDPTGIDGLPNIACGVVCMVLTFFFFWNLKFSLREKLAALAVLLILFLSLNVNLLDYVWHGFHFPNQVPHRFGFILSFCLAVLALRAMAKMDNMDKWDIIGSGVFTGIFLACGGFAIFRDEKPIFGDGEIDGKLILVLNVALCAFYLLIVYLKMRKQVKTQAFVALMGFVMMLELVPSAYLGVKAVGTTSYAGYEYNHVNTYGIIDYVKEQNQGVSFYRMDFNEGWSCNDPALYGYDGISVFSSTATADVTSFMHAIGMPSDEASNRYAYKQNTPVANAFLNLKYLISKETRLAMKDKNYLSFHTAHGGLNLYENTAYLPLAFMTDSKIRETQLDQIQVFRTQNQLFRNASGLNRDVFVPLALTSGEHVGLTIQPVTESDGGYQDNYNYQYKVIPNSTEIDLVMEAVAGASGSIYGYITIPGADQAEIRIDGKRSRSVDLESDRVKQAAIYLGEVTEGQTVTITAKIPSHYINGYCNIQAEILDHAAFEEGLALLADETMTLTEFNDTTVKGTVSALKDGILYTSIPYEKGWTVLVDGAAVETVAIGGAMIGVPLTQGNHTVEFSFSPYGFNWGAICTAVALVALVAISILQKKRPFLPCDTLTLPVVEDKKPAEEASTEACPEQETTLSEEEELPSEEEAQEPDNEQDSAEAASQEEE